MGPSKMGALPFTDRFAGRADNAHPQDRPTVSVAPSDKLALIEEIEQSGSLCFWAADHDCRLTYLSPFALKLLESDQRDVIGRTLQSVFRPLGDEGDNGSLNLKLATRKNISDFATRVSGTGADLVLRLSANPLFDDDGTFIGYRGTARNITKTYRNDEEAEKLAKFDSLTGLANRHRMERLIDTTLLAFRSTRRAAALLMLDLDRFKHVNDTLGHAAGDQLLKQVADRLKSIVAGKGEIARLGGDEFQILVSDMDDRGELGELSRRIIQIVSQPYTVEEGRSTIGCSIGIAVAPYDGADRQELARSADLALYASKNGGRGQFRFYASDIEQEASLRKRMEDDLAQALDDGHFMLEYQPIIDLKDNRVTAVEAQFSWDDIDRGRVSAETILPIAESSRLIIPIGEWALRKACEDAKAWPDSIRLAIPITATQFEAIGFVELIAAVLDETDFEADRLELQLPEGVLLGEASTVDRTLSQLFKLGVKLTLDHFGSGFSSLTFLRRAPLNSLRIGESFFEPVLGSELGDLAMVRAMVALATALGLKTTASGVHSEALMRELKGMGVNRIQGFVFSELLSAEAITEAVNGDVWQIDPSADGTQRASRRTTFRRVGVIHEDHYYNVTLRNLSRSGAMIEGLKHVPIGTVFVLDFGEGQLAVCTVRRTMDDTQGLEFEQELVDDGAGGLCTRHRVSPYELAAAGARFQTVQADHSAVLSGQPTPHSFARFSLSANAPKQRETHSSH